MTPNLRTAAACAAIIAASCPAGALQAGDLARRATLTLASDYIDRGVAQTGGRGQAALGAEAQEGPVYAGVWTSNLAPRPGAAADALEIQAYAGVRGDVDGWRTGLGVRRHDFLGSDGARRGFAELYADVSHDLGGVRVRLDGVLRPRGDGRPVYLALSAERPVAPRLTAAAELGRTWRGQGPSETHWGVGAAYALSPALRLGLRWTDTSRHDLGQAHEGRATVFVQARIGRP